MARATVDGESEEDQSLVDEEKNEQETGVSMKYHSIKLWPRRPWIVLQTLFQKAAGWT